MRFDGLDYPPEFYDWAELNGAIYLWRRLPDGPSPTKIIATIFACIRDGKISFY